MKEGFFGTLKKLYIKYKVIFIIVAIAVLAAVPQFISSNSLMRVLSNILMYCTLAGSLNAINGYSGQFSIGHAGFFCIGAYFEAILATRFGINFWVLLPLAGVAASLIGFLVALPTLKMKGIYLSIVTLGFSEIVRLIALNWDSLTGGPMGIKNIPIPTFFGVELKGRTFYYVFLALAVIFTFVTGRVIKSRVGRAWMSIREDQLAAQSLGVQASGYKALNFMYGAFWAGVVGAAYAPFYRFIDSTHFTLDQGFNVLSMVIIGGQGTLIGPVVGSTIVGALTELLRPFGQWRLVAYAVLIIVMMWVRPQGLAGASDSILAGNRLRKKQLKAAKKEVSAE